MLGNSELRQKLEDLWKYMINLKASEETFFDEMALAVDDASARIVLRWELIVDWSSIERIAESRQWN